MIGLVRETVRLVADVAQGLRDEAGRKSLQLAEDVADARHADPFPGREKTLAHAIEDVNLAVSDLLFALSGWAK